MALKVGLAVKGLEVVALVVFVASITKSAPEAVPPDGNCQEDDTVAALKVPFGDV